MNDGPNIARVTVRDVEVSRDHDLGAEPAFEFETDAGGRYRVVAEDEGYRWIWTVTRIDGQQETPIGTVRHGKSSGILAFSAHDYYRVGDRFSAGSQNDLWNAVQALAE